MKMVHVDSISRTLTLAKERGRISVVWHMARVSPRSGDWLLVTEAMFFGDMRCVLLFLAPIHAVEMVEEFPN